MPFALHNNKLIPLPSKDDTKNMLLVNDHDSFYPSLVTSPTDQLDLPPSKERLPAQLHTDGGRNGNSTIKQQKHTTLNSSSKMKTKTAAFRNEQAKQDKQLDDLDIGSIHHAVIPSILEVMATPTDGSQLFDIPASVPRIPSRGGSYRQQRQVATVPVILETSAAQHIPTHKDTILKTGRMLCAKSSVWYTSLQQRRLHRQTPGQEQQRGIQRQETHLGWREFRAVLKPHCLELYLVSPLLLHGPRLAHTIYFTYHTKSTNAYTKPSLWRRQQSYRRKSRHSRPSYHSNHSTVKLSLASMADYTIRLEHQNRTGGITTFLLNAPSVSGSQSWYMALFKQIPMKTLHSAYAPLSQGRQAQQQQITSKKPIPPWLDIMIPANQESSKTGAANTTFIRIPLDSVVDQNPFCVIRAKDLKRCVFQLLNDSDLRKGFTGCLMTPDAMSLCWRYGQRIEWIHDSASLICPQLIEKEHVLELRFLSPQTGQALETPVAMEGFLIQSTNAHGQFTHKHQSRMYALTDGHYLFLIDPSKAVLPNQQESQKRGWSLNWLSAATLMNLYPRRYGNGKQNQQNKVDRHHYFQSVPGFFAKPSSSQNTKASFFFRHKRAPNTGGGSNDDSGGNGGDDSNARRRSLLGNLGLSGMDGDDEDDEIRNLQEEARTADRIRRAGQVGYAYAVIDLSLVSRVQPVRINKNNDSSQPPSTTVSRAATTTPSSPISSERQPFSTLISASSTSSSSQLLKNEINNRQKRLFELIMVDDAGTRIQFEATSTQAMFEWVQRLRRCIQHGYECRSKGIVLSQAISSLWYQNIHKIILQSGVLYVRKNTQKTYRRYLCVLSRGNGLLLYRYNRHGIMTRRRTIKLIRPKGGSGNKSTYVYALDQAAELKSDDAPTTMMTSDGVRTRGEVHQCAFVVWQRYSFSKNHWIMQIQEHISLLKLGHRLGRKGHSFVFLASTVEEKEAWIWALQQELEH